MGNWLRKVKKYLFAKPDNSIPGNHKICPKCDGNGYEDIWAECEFCDGKGYIRMTYQEYVDELPKE
jgi:RecJ-like exonuclease